MDIYSKGKFVHSIKRFVARRENSLFLCLKGINIEEANDGLYVDEIYMPLITISLDGGMLFLDFAKPNGGFLTFIFSRFFPFLYIGTAKESIFGGRK